MITQQDIKAIRSNFPILAERRRKGFVYLDNAATSLTPISVIDAMNKYYNNYNSNVHRGIYETSQKATKEYEKARKKIAGIINAKPKEIIFTKSTTESLNLLAYSLLDKFNEGDEIVLTEMEHHSNLVPWQQLAKKRKISIKYIPVDDYKINLQKVKKIINKKTRLVSTTYMSNISGTINDVKKISKIAHSKNALFVVDAAQAVPHFSVDIHDIDCDFMAFSGHKMLGPTGIGVLYGKEKLLEKMCPFLFGGDMISLVTFDDSKWNDIPWKFEAGTPNIAGAIGLGKAVDFLKKMGMDKIEEYENYLTRYTILKMLEIDGLKIYGPKNKRGSVISFNLDGIHPHDVAEILDKEGIAIRGGHMCAMPFLTNNIKSNAICRVSLYFYNTIDEIDRFLGGLKKARGVLGHGK